MSQFDLLGLEKLPATEENLTNSKIKIKTLDEQIEALQEGPRDKNVFSIGDDDDDEEEDEEDGEEDERGGFSMPDVGLLSALKVTTSGAALDAASSAGPDSAGAKRGQFFTPVFDGSAGKDVTPTPTLSSVVAPPPFEPPTPTLQYSHTKQPTPERRAALEAAIQCITQDHFPDTDALSASVFELGRVPSQHRLPVLLLLLAGSVSLDHEACTLLRI